jgi:hypothetical protein
MFKRGPQALSAADRLLGRAWKEAEDLGHDWVGGEHFLLALLRPGDDSVAAQALRDAGLTHEAFAEAFVHVLADAEEAKSSRRPKKPKPRREVKLNPAAYQSMGFAEGVAAGLGATAAGPEHVVVAVIWDQWSPTTRVLQRLGVRREDIVDRLAGLGVPLPPVGLPPLAERSRGKTVVVPIEQLRALVAELPGLLPPGSHFGFNHDGEQGWLTAGEGVDLPKYIALALDAWERRRLPCPCCGNITLDLDVPLGERRCDVCYWIQDPVQTSDWTYRGGANEVNLAEARDNFARLGASQEKFRDAVRAPRPGEVPPWRGDTRSA